MDNPKPWLTHKVSQSDVYDIGDDELYARCANPRSIVNGVSTPAPILRGSQSSCLYTGVAHVLPLSNKGRHARHGDNMTVVLLDHGGEKLLHEMKMA